MLTMVMENLVLVSVSVSVGLPSLLFVTRTLRPGATVVDQDELVVGLTWYCCA